MIKPLKSPFHGILYGDFNGFHRQIMVYDIVSITIPGPTCMENLASAGSSTSSAQAPPLKGVTSTRQREIFTIKNDQRWGGGAS